MFCPKCGIQTADEIKFCTSCGANLRGVREAITGRTEQFDWSKTWLADMFMTRKELDRLRGITPEQKRVDELKAGVITSFAGIGVMIFLYWFFDAVANGKSSGDAEIVRRIWLAGVIPFLIGIGIIINGLLFVPRRGAKTHEPLIQIPQEFANSPDPPIAKTTNQLAISGGSPINEFSVTEGTTSHLSPKAELDEKAGPIFAPKTPQ